MKAIDNLANTAISNSALYRTFVDFRIFIFATNYPAPDLRGIKP